MIPTRCPGFGQRGDTGFEVSRRRQLLHDGANELVYGIAVPEPERIGHAR